MLLHFSDDVDRGRYIEPFRNNSQCLIDRREIVLFKFHVDYRTNNLHNAAGGLAVVAYILH